MYDDKVLVPVGTLESYSIARDFNRDVVRYEDLQTQLGEALAETLRHVENQIKYGSENGKENPLSATETCSHTRARTELDESGCDNHMYDLFSGADDNVECAMSYFWGNFYSRHRQGDSILEGRLGIAPTPGSTKVLDRETGKLVNCTEEVCPYGETYADIGRVNRAPYAGMYIV